jgi:glycerol-3-phosphate dehydrogenase
MAISKVFVIGAGTMGNGIAQVSAQAGYSVTMSDIKDEFVKKGMDTISKSLDRGVKKGTMQESEKAAILARIKGTIDMKDAKDWSSRKAFSNSSMKYASRMLSWLPILPLSPSVKLPTPLKIPAGSSVYIL